MTEQKQELKGYVHSLESFGSVDGPGVRYVIFLTGCAMRCQFCHNPDTWNMRAGTLYTAEELLKQALRYRTYWGNEGGITVSGGEPLLQIDFLIELFKKAKEQGVHTTLDTSGNPFTREEPFWRDIWTRLENRCGSVMCLCRTGVILTKIWKSCMLSLRRLEMWRKSRYFHTTRWAHINGKSWGWNIRWRELIRRRWNGWIMRKKYCMQSK